MDLLDFLKDCPRIEIHPPRVNNINNVEEKAWLEMVDAFKQTTDKLEQIEKIQEDFNRIIAEERVRQEEAKRRYEAKQAETEASHRREIQTMNARIARLIQLNSTSTADCSNPSKEDWCSPLSPIKEMEPIEVLQILFQDQFSRQELLQQLQILKDDTEATVVFFLRQQTARMEQKKQEAIAAQRARLEAQLRAQEEALMQVRLQGGVLTPEEERERAINILQEQVRVSQVI